MCHRSIDRMVGSCPGAASGRLRDGNGISVQSAAELAYAATGLGACAWLAAFAGMACASSRVAAVD
jgi:hypothetical protein